MKREQLRTTFDRVAELYQKRLPHPPQLFDDLVALCGVPDGGRVLEIGCGTGQATVPMAERGYRITAVELGANLAVVARRNLARFPNDVEVQNADFDRWPLPAEPFDIVMSFNAWHWLDPEVALPKAASALRPGGTLAIIEGAHPAGGTEQFFIDMQECYERHMPGTPPGLRQQPADEIAPNMRGLDASPLFDPPTHRRYLWERAFTTESYLGELNTYSGHIALSDENRRALLACIEQLIDTRYGGHITKAYLTDLHVARRA